MTLSREALRDATRVALAKMELAHEKLKAFPSDPQAIAEFQKACDVARAAFKANP